MLRESSPLVRILANLVMALIVVVSIGQLSGFFYEADKSDFIRMEGLPVLYSAKDWRPTYKFHPGEAIIVENHAIKNEIGCYAEYHYTLNGPVNYAVVTGKSRQLKPRGTTHEINMKNFIPIPENFPTGVYRLQLIVYPTCDGIPRDPFNVYDHKQPWIQVYGNPVS